MYYRRRIFTLLIILSVLTLSIFTGCSTSDNTSESYEIPVFSTGPSNLSSRTEEIKSKLDMSEENSFRISEIGFLSYYRFEANANTSPMKMSDEEAIHQAEEYLNDLGLLPTDAYRTSVSRTSFTEIDPVNGAESSPITTSIDVFFYRVFNDLDVVSDQDDGIILSFDANGIDRLEYFWRPIETGKITEAGKPISADDAYQVYLDQWDTRHGTCCEPCNDPVIRKVYAQFNGVTRPCWVVAEDEKNLNAWYIDMFTSEVLYG